MWGEVTRLVSGYYNRVLPEYIRTLFRTYGDEIASKFKSFHGCTHILPMGCREMPIWVDHDVKGAIEPLMLAAVVHNHTFGFD